MSVGVALPAFLFEKGRLAPLVLFAIVAVGILAPLGAVVVYITNADEYTPNKVLQSTVAVFTSATEHKNSLSPTRVLPLLLTAHEYQALPVRRAEEEALARLAAELRGEVVDPKDPKFGAMHPATRKALVLLAAHLGRAAVPPELRDDLGAVVALVPRLVEELLRLAQRPRPPQGYAWLRPLLSLLEFSQCFAQAVPVGGRVEGGKAGSAAQGEALLSLLQLPGVDAAAAKKLAKARLRCLADLVLLGPQERDAALASLGLATDALAALGAALDGAPCVTLAALCETVGEEGGEVLEGDLVTCSVRVRLERPRAAAPPRLPLHDKDEGWWVIVGDVASNALFAAHKVALVTHVGLERFAQAARSPPPAAPTVDGVAGAGGDDSAGQLVTLRFKAPPAGVHQAQVMVVCDAWVGVDRRVPLKLRVAKPRATDKPQPQAAPADATAPGDASSDEAEGDAAADLTESGTSESDG